MSNSKYSLPNDRMPEAEVTLRLAIYLIENNLAKGNVGASIDGAQVKTGDTVHFPILSFLNDKGWVGNENAPVWRTTFTHSDFDAAIIIHSTPGEGDVVAELVDGQRLRVESKKGTLARSKSSSEYPLIREAIGQLMTVDQTEQRDLFAVAVPDSEKFCELAARWRKGPLMVKAGLKILTVSRDGTVTGLFD